MAFLGRGLRDIPQNSLAKLKIDSGKSVEVRILTPADEIISVYEHTLQIAGQWKTVTCLGKQVCPLCAVNDRASFKAYLAVLERSDSKVKYWKIGKKVALQLVTMNEEYGGLNDRDFKIYRQGEKLETTYQFIPRDKKPEDLSQHELPNIEEMVTLKTREEIIAMLQGGVGSGSQSPAPSDADAPPSPAGKDDFPF